MLRSLLLSFLCIGGVALSGLHMLQKLLRVLYGIVLYGMGGVAAEKTCLLV